MPATAASFMLPAYKDHHVGDKLRSRQKGRLNHPVLAFPSRQLPSHISSTTSCRPVASTRVGLAESGVLSCQIWAWVSECGDVSCLLGIKHETPPLGISIRGRISIAHGEVDMSG